LLDNEINLPFLTAAVLHVSATGVSQKLPLTKNGYLLKFFTAIEAQTGFVIFYNKEHLQTLFRYLSMYAMPLTDFLDMVLKNQPLIYEFRRKTS